LLHGPFILPGPDREISFIWDAQEVGAYRDIGGRQPFYGVVMKPPKGYSEDEEYSGCDLFYNVPALCAEFFDPGAVAAFRLSELQSHLISY
jgi:hypothetical protein